ncbi:putative repeat protein (TIGR01451 family) [Diaminobutyricimonas aerilata]|uniref:Putative repeat protein (TIGR01451 family) n=1 Tax=Diaminobutyricimonas aerilata TaxID=1162967 RepID=A0A2M9CNV9_9MICO|nr:DUF11 domain-containing protein [Diaminobutyricimonas aerilata]PJJ73583.1 putative repeat protein (TIGR01451 family) [Diaminobutyricimonas aerilata]
MLASVGALALAASALAGSLLTVTPAHAAPGDPFSAVDPLVFVAQGQPTALSRATTDDSGTVSFAPEGAASPITYNAISYNTADNYLYGIVVTGGGNAAFPDNSLVRIGQSGQLTRVGTATYPTATNWNVGVFGPDGYLYIGSSGAGSERLMNVINVTTGAVVRTLTLNAPNLVADLAYADGYFWGLLTSGTTAVIQRIHPTTGVVDTFTTSFQASGFAGAAWTFGNGNLGFSVNTTGDVLQVGVTDPAAATPTFTLVAVSAGPASGNNDGAAVGGLPTDLSVVKTGPASVVPAGGTASYTLTVTNNGPGNSSGFVVNDAVPAPLTNVQSTDDACTVTGNDVRCVGGRLIAGSSATYTITADVPANVTSAVANTATVTSNEEDPTPGNNTSTSTAPLAGMSLTKHAGVPVDVNENGITDAGDTIQYTFDVANTGQLDLSDIAVDDPKVGDVTCPVTTLAVGGTTTCSAESVYTVTADDVTAGAVINTATVSASTPDGQEFTSTPSTTSTPTEAPAPALTLVKSADPSSGTLEPGQEITYHFVVTNTGNVPLSDITVDEGTFSGTGELSAVTCPATTLAVDAQVICEATYTLTPEDVDAGEVTNSATASGTPADGTPITSAPSEVTIPTPEEPGISVVKTAEGDISEAGQVVEYSFLVTNTGNVTLTDVVIDEGDFSGTGEVSAIDCPTTTIFAGQFITCTATYEVTQADVDAGGITNTAAVGGTPPSGVPIGSDPSTAQVTIDPAPALTLVKTADADVAVAGQVIEYSFLLTNTGNVTIAAPAVNEVEFSGSGELSAVTCPATDPLAPGDSLTCTATYTVTAEDVDAGELTNTAAATGTTPAGDPTVSAPSTATIEVGAVVTTPPTTGGSGAGGRGLVATGAEFAGPAVGVGFLLLLLGGATLMVRRQAARREGDA